MITREFAERYRDSYEPELTIDEYVDFFHDCQKATPEDEAFGKLTDEDLRELAKLVIEINEEGDF